MIRRAWCYMALAALSSFFPLTAQAGTITPLGDPHVIGDFDNDGNLDTVIGVPGAGSGPGCDGKGEIKIFYDAFDDPTGFDSSSPDASWDRGTSGVLGTADCGDYFGASIGVTDIDGDGYDDLVVGVPGDTISTLSEAGSIHIFYGSTTGLTTTGDQIFSQDTTSVAGVAEADDWFGVGVAGGDFDCDGYGDVVVGAPREDIGSLQDAGYAVVIYGTSTGLSGSGSTGWHQNTSGVAGGSEAGDELGGFVAAGNINGDKSGSIGCDDILLAAPGEAIGTATDAGSVNVLYGGTSGISSTGDAIFHQNSSGVSGVAEVDDLFGTGVLSYDYDDDGYDDMLVYIPGEAIPGGGDGRFQVFYGAALGLSTNGDGFFEVVEQCCAGVMPGVAGISCIQVLWRENSGSCPAGTFALDCANAGFGEHANCTDGGDACSCP